MYEIYCITKKKQKLKKMRICSVAFRRAFVTKHLTKSKTHTEMVKTSANVRSKFNEILLV